MSLKVDRLQLEIVINNDQARKSLRLLDDEARNIQKSMKGMKDGTDEWIQATKRLNSIKNQMDGIQDSIGITGMSLKELSAKQKEFNMLVSNLPGNSPEYAKYKKTLDEINARMGELKGKAADVNTKLKEQGDGGGILEKVRSNWLMIAGVWTAALAAGAGVINFFKDAVEGAMADERAETKLRFALNGNIEATERMIRFKEQLMKTTLFSKDEIMNAINMGIELGRTEEETKKLVETAMGLARVTGRDLNDLMLALSGTYEGQTGRLGKLSGELKGLSEEQLKNGEAIDILNKKYGKFSSEGMDTVEGKMTQLKKIWQEFKDSVGAKVLPVMLNVLTDVAGTAEEKLQLAVSRGEKILKDAKENLEKNKGKEFMGNTAVTVKEAEAMVASQERGLIRMKNELDLLQKKALLQKETNDLETSKATFKTDLKAAGSKYYAPPGMTEEEKQAQKDREHSAEEHAKYLKKIQKDLEDALIQSVKDQHEKELKLAELEHTRKLAEITGHTKDEEELRNALNAQYETQKAQINKKFSDNEVADAWKIEKEKWEAKIKSAGEGEPLWFLFQTEFLDKQKEFELRNTDLTEQEKLDIIEKYRLKKEQLDQGFTGPVNDGSAAPTKRQDGQLIKKSGASDLGALQLNEKRKLLEMERDLELQNAEGSAEDQKKIWDEFYAARGDATMDFVNQAVSVASQALTALSSIFQAMNAHEDSSLKKDELANNQKKANLKKQLDAKLITQKQYDAGVAKLDIDMENKKKEIAHKQAIRQKEMAVFNATIALLQAIIQAANIAPPADIVMPIIIAALMGVQLAALVATPVPAAAEGRYNVIGQQDGKSYNNLPYKNSFTGIPGRPMLVNETGNEIVIDPYTTRNIQMNYPHIIEGINQARVPQRASGQYPDSGGSRSSGSTQISIGFDDETKQEMKNFREQLKKPLRAGINYDEMRDSFDTVGQIEQNATR